jgi:hypothetical protein
MGGFMKYAIELSSGGMVHKPSFMMIDTDFRNMLEEDTHRDTQQNMFISPILFFSDNKISVEKVNSLLHFSG